MERRALLLSGGNARGPIAQVTLEHLDATPGREKYATVLGVSVGSLEAPCFALGLLPVLRRLWLQVDGIGFYMRLDPLHIKRGIYSLAPLENVYRAMIRPHWNRLRACSAPRVGVGVYDLADDCYRTVWADECEELDEWASATMASCAMAPVMHWYPVRVGGEEHPACDGGVKRVLPLLPDWKDYTHFDAILHSPTRRITPEHPWDVDSILEITERLVEASIDNVIKTDLARLRMHTRAGLEGRLFSPPTWPGRSFDASAETMRWRLNEIGPMVWSNVDRLG